MCKNISARFPWPTNLALQKGHHMTMLASYLDFSFSKSTFDLHKFNRSALFSLLHHSWISPLLRKRRQQGTLDLSDLYDVPSDLRSSQLTDELEANWFDEVKRHPKDPNLIRATIRTMGWKPFLLGLLEIFYVRIKNSCF